MTSYFDMKSIKAIFLDLDNTLIMTRTADAQACEMVSKFNFSIRP